MGNILHTNNATSTLASGITAGATSITVGAGHGALFPAVGGSLYAMLTIENAAGVIEIVKLTAKSGDVFTVVRGQEGTVGYAFSAGARVENRVTAGVLDGFVQKAGDVMTGDLDMDGNDLIDPVISGAAATISAPTTVSAAVTFTGSSNIVFQLDNKELRFGTGGDDLAIYHDGTNNYIDANTGDLWLRGPGATSVLKVRGDLIPLYVTASDACRISIGTAGFAAERAYWGFPTNGSDNAIMRNVAGASLAFRVSDNVTRLEVTTTGVVFAGTPSGTIEGNTATLTGTAVSNISSAVTVGAARYQRIGNFVTCSFTISCSSTAAGGTISTIRVSLPIASNFTSIRQAIGSGAEDFGRFSVGVRANTGTDDFDVSWVPDSTSSRSFNCVVQYEIV